MILLNIFPVISICYDYQCGVIAGNRMGVGKNMKQDSINRAMVKRGNQNTKGRKRKSIMDMDMAGQKIADDGNSYVNDKIYEKNFHTC